VAAIFSSSEESSPLVVGNERVVDVINVAEFHNYFLIKFILIKILIALGFRKGWILIWKIKFLG